MMLDKMRKVLEDERAWADGYKCGFGTGLLVGAVTIIFIVGFT